MEKVNFFLTHIANFVNEKVNAFKKYFFKHKITKNKKIIHNNNKKTK